MGLLCQADWHPDPGWSFCGCLLHDARGPLPGVVLSAACPRAFLLPRSASPAPCALTPSPARRWTSRTFAAAPSARWQVAHLALLPLSSSILIPFLVVTAVPLPCPRGGQGPRPLTLHPRASPGTRHCQSSRSVRCGNERPVVAGDGEGTDGSEAPDGMWWPFGHKLPTGIHLPDAGTRSQGPRE